MHTHMLRAALAALVVLLPVRSEAQASARTEHTPAESAEAVIGETSGFDPEERMRRVPPRRPAADAAKPLPQRVALEPAIATRSSNSAM